MAAFSPHVAWRGDRRGILRRMESIAAAVKSCRCFNNQAAVADNGLCPFIETVALLEIGDTETNGAKRPPR